MTPATRRLLMNSKPNAYARAAGAFASASSQYATAPDAATNSPTGDCTLVLWAYLATKAADRNLVAKFDQNNTTTRAWKCFYRFSDDSFVWDCRGPTTSTSVAASSLGSPATARWYFIACRHRAGINLGIQINGGAEDLVAFTDGFKDSAAPVRLGATQRDGVPEGYHDGRLGAVLLCNTVLDNYAVASLYNGGKGRSLTSLTGAEKSGWRVTFGVDFAGLNASTWPDVIGGLTLSNTNGVTAAAGPGA